MFLLFRCMRFIFDFSASFESLLIQNNMIATLQVQDRKSCQLCITLLPFYGFFQRISYILRAAVKVEEAFSGLTLDTLCTQTKFEEITYGSFPGSPEETVLNLAIATHCAQSQVVHILYPISCFSVKISFLTRYILLYSINNIAY